MMTRDIIGVYYPVLYVSRDVMILNCWNYGSLSMHYKNLAISHDTWRIPLNILAITTIDRVSVQKKMLKWNPPQLPIFLGFALGIVFSPPILHAIPKIDRSHNRSLFLMPDYKTITVPTTDPPFCFHRSEIKS